MAQVIKRSRLLNGTKAEEDEEQFKFQLVSFSDYNHRCMDGCVVMEKPEFFLHQMGSVSCTSIILFASQKKNNFASTEQRNSSSKNVHVC